MQTKIHSPDNSAIDTAQQEAEEILRNCVHCGFCNATCPTYQITGNELDGPRGRIYLIKDMLEGNSVSRTTQQHLDRCLSCRSCETTCPSGVQYHRLLDFGRQQVDAQTGRPIKKRLLQFAINTVLPKPQFVFTALKLGRWLKPALPKRVRRRIPSTARTNDWPSSQHSRRVLMLEGCVQSATQPNTNTAMARVLDRLGISCVRITNAQCCGAIGYHNNDQSNARAQMRANIDLWWPEIEQGAEAIVVAASGCGLMLHEYADALRNDSNYADKARRISQLQRDASEILLDEDLTAFKQNGRELKVAYQSPCSSQHGLKLGGKVEKILQQCGYSLVQVAEAHLCCGAAGTYSLTQPALSQTLLKQKLQRLEANQPSVIATANIGCHLHLGAAANVPVKHWLELLDEGSGRI